MRDGLAHLQFRRAYTRNTAEAEALELEEALVIPPDAADRLRVTLVDDETCNRLSVTSENQY